MVFAALQGRSPGAAGPDPRGDVPGGPPGRLRGPGSGPGSTATAGSLFQDIEADYLIGAYADIADRVVGKGSLPGRRAVQRAGRPDPRPERPLAHRAVHRVPRLRQPADQLGRGVHPRRGRPGAGDGPARDPAAQPGPQGRPRSSRSTRPATATGSRRSGSPPSGSGGGRPCRAGRGRGIALGIKSGPTTGLSYSIVRLLGDGCVVVYAGTSDMGQGARTVLAQIAAQELGAPLDWVTVVMGDTAIVPYDQQTSASRSTVLMGNSVLAACRVDPGASCGRWRPGSTAWTRRRSRWTRAWSRLPDDRELTVLEVLKPGLGKLGGELTGLGEVRKDAEPGAPARAAPPRSSSSTARRSRPRWTARPAT